MLQEALAEASVVDVRGDAVIVHVAEGSVHRQGLEAKRKFVDETLVAVFGRPLRLAFDDAPRDAPAPATPSRRLDPQAEKTQRLKGYRAKDPTLDAVAEALDLELLE
jgi:hypothetical protein